ncbi:MAG: mechanosensitive ion channel [Geminicoccaceae bacterium]
MKQLARSLLAALLLLAGPTASMAKSADSPSSPSSPSPDQIKAYLEHRSDPVVGAWIEQQLHEGGAVPPAGGEAAPVPPESAGGAMAGYLDGRVGVIEGHLHELAAELPNLPAELAAAGGRLIGEVSDRGVVEIVLLLAAFVALGIGAELLFVRATAGTVARLQAQPTTAPGPRARVAGSLLLMELARVLCFAVGSIGGFVLFTWPHDLRQVVLGYLTAILVIRLVAALARFVFAPDAPRLRVLPMDDAAAGLWQSRVVAFVACYTLGYVTVSLLHGLGMSLPGVQLLAYLIGLGLLAIAVDLIWRAVRSPAGRIVGTVLAVLIWLAWVVGAKPGMWALIVATGVMVLVRATHRAVLHMFRSEAAEGADATAAPSTAWAVIVDRGLRALVILGGLWLLSWGWGLDVVEIAGRDTPSTRLLIGALHAVVILLLADLVWQLVRQAIDSQLRRAGPAGGHGDTHGIEASPEELRRRGRLRTLLPILRIVLMAVIAVMAVLMALSALGVQVGPLIAGAGVVGVAIGFGSQTLVKDIISGMFYLMDDAFRVGEYIVSGNYRGTVEGFSLRSIRLRHHRGPVYTVPFGVLGAVQNLSRDWVIDKVTVGVTYDTNLDLVKKVVKQVSKEIMADPALAGAIIEPLKSQGVAAMGDFAIQVRMKFMAKPGQQFTVRRVVYDKIKKAFDANGIKFAFPTVTVAGGDATTAAAVTAFPAASGNAA